MSSQHRDPPLNIRPPNEDRQAALAALTKMGFNMTQLVTAALRRFARDPGGTHAFLKDDWPEPKPMGRPRREVGQR